MTTHGSSTGNPQAASFWRRRRVVGLMAASCGFGLLVALGAWGKTVTIDEPFHLMYSRQALREGTFVRWIPGNEVAHNSKMPASLPNAAVSVALDRKAAPVDPQTRLFLERLPTIAWGIVAAIYTFLFALRLFGTWPAWLCLGFFLTEPNLLAHSGLITTDVAATAGTVAFLYHLHSYLLRPDAKHALILGAMLGLAQVSKYSCVILFPITVIAVLGYRFIHRRPSPSSAPAVRPRWRAVAGHLVLAAAGMLLVINLAFGFEGTFHPYPETPPDPSKFAKFGAAGAILRHGFAVVRPLLGLFPNPYLQGLSMVLQNDREGPGPHVYVLGRLTDKGVPWYFLVVTAFKWTLPVLGLFAASLAVLAWRRFRAASTLVLLILLPVGLMFLHVSFRLNHQFGVRYLLPVIALAILGGPGFLAAAFPSRPIRAALLALLGWQVLATALWFPYWLSYTNELLPDKNRAWTLFADSNLQWGQDDGELEEYVKRHPGERLVVDPGAAAAGRLVVGVNELAGQSNRIDYFMLDRYAWLREAFRPVGRITHSFLVFDVSQAALDSLYGRASSRAKDGDFPRLMTQWFPPWIPEGEPVPTVEVWTRTTDGAGTASAPVVVAALRSRTAKARPWNVWIEEIASNGERRPASEAVLVKVGRDQPCDIELPLKPRMARPSSLRAWVGIFPDRYVASADVQLP